MMMVSQAMPDGFRLAERGPGGGSGSGPEANQETDPGAARQAPAEACP